MPDGHGLRCFRVTIKCGSGRVLRPIISAKDEAEANAKAATLAAELCRVTLPWLIGAKDDRVNYEPPQIVDTRRVHRWWTE